MDLFTSHGANSDPHLRLGLTKKTKKVWKQNNDQKSMETNNDQNYIETGKRLSLSNKQTRVVKDENT